MKKLLLILFVVAAVAAHAQNKSYSFVFLNKKTDAEPMEKAKLDKVMEGHMANITRLAGEGKLVAAGPFEGGGGIFVLNTTDIAQAREWLSTDPGVQANRWNIEVLPYTSRTGGVCAVSAPYEMVMYSFIRFTAIVSKATATSYPEIIRKHNEYLKKLIATGNVITEGIFGENEGGIIVVKGDLQKEVIENDPGVQEGLLELQSKDLWIAKGSFCEK